MTPGTMPDIVLLVRSNTYSVASVVALNGLEKELMLAMTDQSDNGNSPSAWSSDPNSLVLLFPLTLTIIEDGWSSTMLFAHIENASTVLNLFTSVILISKLVNMLFRSSNLSNCVILVSKLVNCLFMSSILFIYFILVYKRAKTYLDPQTCSIVSFRFLNCSCLFRSSIYVWVLDLV